MEREDLECVRHQETGESNVVEDPERPDADELRVPAHHIRHVRVLVDGAQGGPASKGDEHATRRDQEQRPAPEAVHVQRRGDRDGEVQDCLARGHGQLLVLARDPGAAVDGVHVVGEERVARVLRDDPQRDQDRQPPAVAPGAEEVQVRRGAVRVAVHLDRLLDLLVLELDDGVVDVAAGVVPGEHDEGLVVAVHVDEVARGLGQPVDEGQLDYRGDDLDEGYGAPGPVVVDVGCAPADRGHDFVVRSVTRLLTRVKE